MTVLTSDDDNRSMKEAVSLLQVIGHMSKELPPDDQEFIEVQGWVLKVCTDMAVGESTHCLCVI